MAFVNFKGGVGKTSLVVNLASCLAHELDRRVLVVDCDAQCNASIWLAGPTAFVSRLEANPQHSLHGLLTGHADALETVWKSPIKHRQHLAVPSLDLMPAAPELMDIEDDFAPEGGMNAVYAAFYRAIKKLWPKYDYILFDCPPNFYRATRCAVFASREIYIPCHPDALSNMGIAPLRRKLVAFYADSSRVQRRLGKSYAFAKVRGAIINREPTSANIEESVEKISLKLKTLRDFPDIVADDVDVMPVRIRQTIEASRVVEGSIPAVLANGNSQLTNDYRQLAFYIDGTGDKYECV
ncbi:MAG: ParA family protein [Myxococcota bacterium]